MNSRGIESLCFFKSLQVCRIELEPRRAKASYVLTLNSGESLEKELIYSYQEDVFDDGPDAWNMASVMLAQVALNYGLFCESIVFEGCYDDVDKRFLMEMTENTSREIFVNKFLMPNPFILQDYRDLTHEGIRRFTNARVEFRPVKADKPELEWKHNEVNRNRFIVLSSGGKESLLSYALLREIGKEVLPVYTNESGRHWFTAMNAYKHMKDAGESPGKVWSNADRIYTWMLRQMPCIRKDFASVRADIYPVRLWTLPVFLFASLPLARKRAAGTIVIGNEYDTSMKDKYDGITHYKGLYDQSRYFDNAMTRYYTKKGWNLHQYSILRGLSELLILKILAKRYPSLQAQQVSCHSASVRDGRAFPCGKCEKCRRIVSMLSVLEASPGNCGYTPVQIETALKTTGNSGVKQIDSDARHLYHLLLEQGMISAQSPNASFAREEAAIMKLRFDTRRNSLNEFPGELLGQLLPIYLEYAHKAVRRTGRQWQTFDITRELEGAEPYPFVIPANGNKIMSGANAVNWESFTWKEMEEKLKEVDTAILPCGSIEQHGPHLPVDVDYYDSIYLANKVAEACSNPKPLVLPALPYGVAYHHDAFKGTISITNQTLSSLVYDIGISLVRNGIKKIIILNAHGDNAPTLLYAAQLINRDTGAFVCVESGETSDPDIDILAATPNDIHAGEIETSTTLAIRPEVVRMDHAIDEVLDFGSSYLDYTSSRGVAWYVRTELISTSGVMGAPTRADAEKGRKIWEIMIAHLVRFIEEVKKSQLEELYQRKY